MMHIPTKQQLEEKVSLVEVTVSGEYIARIDDRRTTSKHYEVKVLVPERFNKSDIKRATPKALHLAKDDFVSMRTFEQNGAAKKTDKKVKRKELYSTFDLARFKKRSDAIEKEKRERRASSGQAEDTTEYDERTGLPAVFNEPGGEIGE